MNIKNKTLIFLGSSVTFGDGGYSMCESITAKTGANVVKWAVSGTTLSSAMPNSYVERFLKVIDSQEKCDLFITQLSTNDAGKDMELGVISDSFDKKDFDTKTTIGAIEFIIATAREKWGCPIAFYTGTYYESGRYQKMVDALLEISKKWDIGVIDLWNSEKMRAVSEENYERYMINGVHPNKTGYDEWWTPEFIEYIQNL